MLFSNEKAPERSGAFCFQGHSPSRSCGWVGHLHSPSVPLTPQLLALLGERKADNVPLFEVSSANAMLNTLKALDGNGFTVHGFCSSFEDWGAEATSLPRDLVKLCTARHPEQDR